MSTWRGSIVAVAMVAATTMAAPAAAQFSDAYKFIKAVKDKDLNGANKLLTGGNSTIVNVRDSATGDTALGMVVRRRDMDWIRFLYFKGADVNLTGTDGSTPLLLAATQGYTEAVEMLLEMKARPDIKNRQGETALIKAVQARDLASVKALLEAGANPDQTDNTGVSARTYAVADARGGPVARLLKDLPAGRTAPVQGPSL